MFKSCSSFSNLKPKLERREWDVNCGSRERPERRRTEKQVDPVPWGRVGTSRNKKLILEIQSIFYLNI